MVDYAPLIAIWGMTALPPTVVCGRPFTAGMSAADKLNLLQMWGVQAGYRDVSAMWIINSLVSSGAYLTFLAFGEGQPTGDLTHDTALAAAQQLLGLASGLVPPLIDMSNSTVYAQVQGLAAAIMAQETAHPGTTGLTQAVCDRLFALAVTNVPWWRANGFLGPITLADVAAAGLV